MNKTILSIAVGVVFFLAFSHSDANVCTANSAAINLNGYRKTSQGLVTISNDTDQCKLSPTNNNNYYTRDNTYRTKNLDTRSESSRVIRVDGKGEERRSESRRAIRVDGRKEDRRFDNRRIIRVDGNEEERGFENRRVIRADGKEGERRLRFGADDAGRVRLTRSESLPDLRRERIRVVREREIVDVRDADRRVLERSDRRFLENRSDQRTFRRDVRDSRRERLISRDDTDTRRRATEIGQSNMVTVKDNDASTSWPFSSFVQSTIGVLGLYYFGMHNKSTTK